ncbi:calcium-binding protein [Mycobacterium kyorinense]|uniref:Calcium-binding protein n=1 Tax=Mycobacterium kyorinense TaxID=487514 RepID=A0A1A2YPI3_9MYCO|nr:excalibur calcium-binding domain-containing protein [Mycobacterium kyorinense]OBI40144.1 calcium-binding protein [Mycobacterium kyorinense]
MIRALLAAAGVVAAAAIGIAPAANAGPPYKNCTEAHNDGRYNIPEGDEAYSSKLDRDGDGLACEPKR